MLIQLKINEIKGVTPTEILRAIRKKLPPILAKAKLPIRIAVVTKLRKTIEQTPEWQSLQDFDGESLAAHFGLTRTFSHDALNNIMNTWFQGVKVDIIDNKPSLQGITFVFKIYMIRDDYSDVLALPQASYISPSSGKKIDWLRWLLLEADKIEIADYAMVFKPAGTPKSRHGKALMVPTKKVEKFWKLPEDFRNPEQYNFISRVLQDVEFLELFTKDIPEVIAEVVRRG